MANVIQFDHVKRCRRFFRILVDQFGLEYFVVPQGRGASPSEGRLRESVAFAADWMTLRTGDSPTLATREVMHRELTSLLRQRLSVELVTFIPESAYPESTKPNR